MPTESTSHYLVVDPALSYYSFAQRITAAEWENAQAIFEDLKALPCTPQLQAVLLAQKEEYYSNRSYNVVFAFS
jgi:hypothetical protein